MRASRLLRPAARLAQWTLRLLLALALLVALAVAALHWWIVPRINDFRPQVESRLSSALGVPVRIEQLQADGSNGLVPAVAAKGVQLLQPDGSAGLSLPEVKVALSVPSLLRLRAEQIAIVAPQLLVQRAADGQLRVAGLAIAASEQSDSSAGADWLFRQREVVLQGGSVVWDDQLRGLPPVTFADVNLLLRNPGLRHEWQISARPPAEWGDVLELRGRMRQPIWALHDGNWKHWSGQLYAEARQLNAAAMAPYLPPAVGLQQGIGTARLWLDVDRGQWKNATADIALRDVGVRRGFQGFREKAVGDGATATADRAADKPAEGADSILLLRSVQGRLGGVADDRGFRLFTDKLAVESASGQHWPGGSAKLNHVYAQGSQPSETEASAQSLDIASLAELARLLPVPADVRQWLASNRPAGLIRSASAHWRGDADEVKDWRAKAEVSQLAFGMPGAPISSKAARDAHGGLVLAAHEAHIGLRGLDVTLDANASGGEATLQFADGALYLPKVFEDPLVPVNELRTRLDWKVQGEKISMQSDKLEFANPHAAGHARWSWRTADPDKSSAHSRFPGVLQLQGVLDRADGTKVHRYLPLHIPAEARHYVRDSILAGQASKVRFELNGDLHDMPFRQPGSGVFRITAPVRDVRYAYVPASHLHPGDKPWPELNKLSGELLFEGAGMQVRQAKGILDGNERIRVEQATATIADFDKTQVIVNAQARGPLADMLATVQRTQVDTLTRGAMAQTVADGDAQLQLQLDLPVHHMEQSKVAGKVLLSGNRIQFHSDAPVVRQVTGAVQFSDHGFALQELRGQAFGGLAEFSGGMDVSGLQPGADHGPAVDVRVSGVATAEGLLQAQELGPTVQLAQWAKGQTPYQLRIRMARGQPLIDVRSDLQGMAVNLPEPLNKAAEQSWPTHFASTLSDASGSSTPLREQMDLDVAGRLQLRYVRELGADAQTPSKVVSGAIRVGPGALALPAKGVVVEANLPRLDVQEWQKALQILQSDAPAAAASASAAAPAPASPATAQPAARSYAERANEYLPDHWDVRVDALQVRGIDVQKLQLRGSRSGARWSSQIQSSLMDGRLDYEQESGGPGTIRARLSQLRVGQEEGAASKAGNSNHSEDASNEQPRKLPALDIVVDDLRWHGHSAGRLELQAVNRSEGAQSWWHLRQMQLSNDAASLQASGDWGEARNASAGPGSLSGRRTQLDIRLDLKDTGQLLQQLGMAGVLHRGKGMLQGKLAWTGSPLNPDYHSMDGQLHIDVGQGQFLKVEPGIAKLFGVLNLQALPRRLTLDFKDIFSAGFGFDFVRGDVQIRDGLASTTNLQMKGVTAAVLLEGKADLRDETQNLHVVVIPELNTTTLSLVTTAINPVIGIGTFLAQALFKGQITQAVTQEFEVTGSWSEPEVKKLARRAQTERNAVEQAH
ncbi:YhdP family protein [Comamonas sp. J-3]|uniref:YhdP family protein n=1 Tax=Comamonas trifloxystrobinivorans TaxID=3350256 RepID=UPI00372BBA8D